MQAPLHWDSVICMSLDPSIICVHTPYI